MSDTPGRVRLRRVGALVGVEQAHAVCKSAEAAYDESLHHAIEVGCSNVEIANAIGQGESSVRRYIDRRGLRDG